LNSMKQSHLTPAMLAAGILASRTAAKYVWAVALAWLGFTAAATGEPVIFSAMGCGPYTPPDKPAVAFYVRQENRERTSEFMVHLGDIFKTSPVKRPDDDAASPAKTTGQAVPPMP